ncbi:hypothetical protein EBB07_03960 [Paenibacillaceae bacterium]|nr:hypothetical protein EBB07_03960 [Paenibacillaceae bacterium]
MPELIARASSYQPLIGNKIWMGSLGDVPALVEKEHCDVIIDLRAEIIPTGKEHPEHYLHFPLIDGEETQEGVINETVETIAALTEHGRRVAFHCASGKSRSGCIAIGLLIRLGQASTVEKAEQLLLAIRPETVIHPKLKTALQHLYRQA